MNTNASKRWAYLFLGFALCAFVGCSGQLTNDFAGSMEDRNGILGGSAVLENQPEARHLVMLIDLETNQICSGTLIRRNVVLTAAHCIPSHDHLLSVFFDVDPLSAASDLAPVQISKTLRHPGYTKNADPSSVDLALVFLSTPAPDKYKLMALPEKNLLAPQLMVDVGGFGRDSLQNPDSYGKLRQAKVPILEVSDGFFEVNQAQGIGICDGDSGGSAFVKGSRGLILVGVTKMAYDKYALGQDSCLGVSQFTRVDKNLSWILQNL